MVLCVMLLLIYCSSVVIKKTNQDHVVCKKNGSFGET